MSTPAPAPAREPPAESPPAERVAEGLPVGTEEAERRLATPGSPTLTAPPDTSQTVYLPMGPFAEFHGLVHKHHLRLEHERDHEAPEAPFPAVDYALIDG